ncbi:hypothetical protein BV898_11979 [Hypsibius exemplaris]|uniref:N-acetyltransferase domain-containing protein n=1 Tax=Hypsibius exemplaris TaxID=2072580 RepID=A0A1W0WEZ7_HYPEX|nr:hypothetical protein BV898_11979 [Hypsibius exemplaris]
MADPELCFQPANRPDLRTLHGRFVRLEKLNTTLHGDALWTILQGPDADPTLWEYLPFGPYPQRKDFDAWLQLRATGMDLWGYCIVDQITDQVNGMISFISIVPEHGRLEYGSVIFGPAMQRSPKGTEAVYLLAKEAFELGNRRLEWKCNRENVRSKRVAERCGFRFEGLFRQHMVVRGRNRDSLYFSMTDREWPSRRKAFEAWLAVENFDASGRQIKTLEDLRNGDL